MDLGGLGGEMWKDLDGIAGCGEGKRVYGLNLDSKAIRGSASEGGS